MVSTYVLCLFPSIIIIYRRSPVTMRSLPSVATGTDPAKALLSSSLALMTIELNGAYLLPSSRWPRMRSKDERRCGTVFMFGCSSLGGSWCGDLFVERGGLLGLLIRTMLSLQQCGRTVTDIKAKKDKVFCKYTYSYVAPS
jgi:hypothetical protein